METYKGYTIEIEQDDDAESPREWDNLGTMICFHRRYSIGDAHNEDFDTFNTFISIENGKSLIALPVYMYDHSSVSLSTTNFFDRWDSGQIGWIYATKEKIREWFDVKRLSKKRLHEAEAALVAEVKTYSQFVSGDVFWYSIKNSEDDTIDSLGGIYGYDEALTEAKTIIDNL